MYFSFVLSKLLLSLLGNKAIEIMKTQINNFKFRPSSGYGHYKVTYTSPVTNKQWSTVTSNMPLIDATKNAENPKIKDLNELKKLCKN